MLSYPEAAAEIMEHLCGHDGDGGHGYSQPHRQGIGTGGGAGETLKLSDGSKVTISTGDRDCSSAVIECYAALGVDCGGASYTGNMKSCMTGTGNFKWHPMGDGYIAKRGDIYLNETHHTAMCLDDDPDTIGQFSISERGTTDGQRGDQTGYEGNVKPYYNYPWDGKLVYCGPARDGSGQTTEGQQAQEPGPGIDEDGYWAQETTSALQEQAGTPVDGEVWGQDVAWEPYYEGVTGGWKWCDGDDVTGSPLIKRMKEALRDRYGQDVGEVDGVADRIFWQALERAAGYDEDLKGLEAPSNTIKWVQGRVNARDFF